MLHPRHNQGTELKLVSDKDARKTNQEYLYRLLGLTSGLLERNTLLTYSSYQAHISNQISSQTTFCR